MPTHVHFEYAPPRSWEHFEELCADLFQAMWSDPALVRHGRSGQRQQGIDIVARRGAEYPVGLQCKRRSRWPVKRLTTTELIREINEAKKFKPALKSFYLLTTAEDDTHLQERVRTINVEHNKSGMFEVVLLGWSELVRRVTLHREVADKHFGAIGGTPAAPLLATWFTSKGKLELKGDDLEVSVQELALDLQDWPRGRIVVRQRESDRLLEEIQAFGSNSLSIERRRRRIELRKKLQFNIDKEQAIVRGITFMLTDPTVSPILVKVWEDETTTTIKAFIERLLKSEPSTTYQSDHELHIWPPGDKRLETRLKIIYPAQLYADISKLKLNYIKKWGKNLMGSVGELPSSVRAGYVIPALVRQVASRLDDGDSLETLKSTKWLDFFSWQVEV